MKKIVFALGFAAFSLLVGCSAKEDIGTSNMTDNISNPISVKSPVQYYDEDYRNSGHDSSDFGFTRLNRSTINGANTANVSNEPSAIDREQLSSIITQLAVQLPDVNDVSTLVTDEDILVVYSTDSKDRSETADQVKKTAMSIVPRYFHVYVSDNEQLKQDLKNFSTLGSDNDNIDYTIEKTIENMLKSPQGSDINYDENANGEMLNDKYDQMDEPGLRKTKMD